MSFEVPSSPQAGGRRAGKLEGIGQEGLLGLRIRRSLYTHISWRGDPGGLRKRIRENPKPGSINYACRRIHALLRRECWPVNVKRVYRLSRIKAGQYIVLPTNQARPAFGRILRAPSSETNCDKIPETAVP